MVKRQKTDWSGPIMILEQVARLHQITKLRIQDFVLGISVAFSNCWAAVSGSLWCGTPIHEVPKYVWFDAYIEMT